jgi:hypothetical protein
MITVHKGKTLVGTINEDTGAITVNESEFQHVVDTLRRDGLEARVPGKGKEGEIVDGVQRVKVGKDTLGLLELTLTQLGYRVK